MPRSITRARSSTRNSTLIAMIAAIGSLFPYGAPVDAQSVYTSDSRPAESLEQQQRPRIEPAIAGGMSALLPGAGQFYNGQNTKGSLMLAGFAASIVVAATGFGDKEVCAGAGRSQLCQTHPSWPNSRFWIGAGAAVGVYAWSVLDAIAVATRAANPQENDRRGADLELAPQLREGGPALAARLRITM